MSKQQRAYVPELAGLDLLRFLLAIVVMLVHYYFFYYYPGATAGPSQQQPFAKVLYPIYYYGANVVQIFWLLSGFIFQTIYFKSISTDGLSFKDYLVLRLSRLYPLHLITLLIVGGLQYLYFQSMHSWFWFETQDLKHFFLQLLFMGTWYPYYQQSFNFPTWSVSIEFFVYIVFFMLAAAGLINKKNLYVLLFTFILFAAFRILDPFGRCLVFFFGGCVIAEHVREGVDVKKLLRQIALLCFPVAAFYVVIKKFQTGMDGYSLQILLDLLLLPVGACILLLFIVVFRNLQSKSIILLFRRLGDLTYSTYLLHYPIIMTIILILHPSDVHVFDRPVFLIGYISVSVAAGWVVCKYFEKPLQALIRRYYERERIRKPDAQTILVEESNLEDSSGSIVPPQA